MKKLYNVTIEVEVVVVAESESDARKHAQDAIDEVSFENDVDYDVRELVYLSGNWDLNCIPFGDRDGDDPDRTIQGWLDAGAGEKYLKLGAFFDAQKAQSPSKKDSSDTST